MKMIIVVLLLALNAAGTRGQTPAGEADAARAAALLSSIETRVPEAVKQIRWLRQTIRTGTSLPPEVLSSLAAVDEALATAGDDPKVRALAVEDLSVKADYCRRHPQGMAALVELSVRTWAAEGSPPPEVSQWNVMYLSAPLAERRDIGEPFPHFSSPTVKRLPPGRYVLWAQHPADAQRRGPRKTVTVGDPNAKLDDRVIADLIVPDSWR